MLKCILYLLVLVSLSEVHAESTIINYNENEPVRLWVFDKNEQSQAKTLEISDKKTQKKARLVLNKVNAEQGLFEGYFILNFSGDGQSSQIFTDSNNLKLEAIKKQPRVTTVKTIVLESKRQEQERVQSELSEAQRREQMIQEAQMLSELERQQKIKKAQALGEEAMLLYRQKKYKLASEKFKEAIDADPQNNKFYFQYGVCLYQMKDYQKSLVMLSMAEEGNYSETEKNYFTGLNHFRLNDRQKAIKYFQEVKEENDPELSPTASFYSGVLQFHQSEYENAKENFEYVLDNSKDKELDRKSESFVEQIENIEQFNIQNRDKFKYSIFFGPTYDSNILNVASANSPTDQAGFRLYYGASLEYRPIYNYFKEWTMNFDISDMYSVNNQFQNVSSLQDADPLSVGFKSPFKWKRQAFDVPYHLTLTPGYEGLLMNNNGQGSRTLIANSYYLKVDNLFAHTSKWFGTYSFEFREENSFAETSSETENLTGPKLTLSTSHNLSLGAKGSQFVILDFVYSNYQAVGDNQKYNKYSLASTYSKPWINDIQISLRADISATQYPNHTSSRSDQIYALTAAGQKSLNKKWTTSLSFGFSKSQSNIDNYTYDKFQVFNLYTYAGGF